MTEEFEYIGKNRVEGFNKAMPFRKPTTTTSTATPEVKPAETTQQPSSNNDTPKPLDSGTKK